MHSHIQWTCTMYMYELQSVNSIVVWSNVTIKMQSYPLRVYSSMCKQLTVHVHVSNSCKTLIGVHEMHLATVLLVHDPLSSLAYPMVTHTPPEAGNLPKKTLVARQWPTNIIHAARILKTRI